MWLPLLYQWFLGPPTPFSPVPARFQHLQGDHSAHPETGEGYRAARWTGDRPSA